MPHSNDLPSTKEIPCQRLKSGASEVGSPGKFSLRFLFGAVAAVSLIAMLFGLVMRSQAALKQQRLLENQRTWLPESFKIVSDAMKFYGNTSTSFAGQPTKLQAWPPTVATDDQGQPLYSWRLPVSCYVSCLCLDIPECNLEEPWNSKDNLAYVPMMGAPFCPSDAASEATAHVFGITGPDTAFDPSAVRRFSKLPPQVIVAVENGERKIKCMQPGDYQLESLVKEVGALGTVAKNILPDRVHVLFADKEVWALSPETPMTAIHPFLTITGAKNADRDVLLSPYRVE